MEMADGVLRIDQFLTVTLGIIVLFVGKRLNDAVAFVREFSIREPVTGGLLFSVLFGIVYAATGVAVEFELAARDILLVYFFTTIGINASLKDLLAGGKPLVLLLVITIVRGRPKPDRYLRGRVIRLAHRRGPPGRHGLTDRRPRHRDRPAPRIAEDY